MLNGLRFLGVCGIVGLALNVSAAADNSIDSGRFQFEDAGNRTVQSFPPSEKAGMQTAPTADWAEDTDAKASETPSRRPATGLLPSRFARQSAGETMSSSRVNGAPAPISGVKNFHRELFSDQPQGETIPQPTKRSMVSTPLRPSKISQTSREGLTDSPAPGASSAANNKRNLIHADYQRSRTASNRGEIRQVQGQQPRFPELPSQGPDPMPHFDELDFGKPAADSKTSDNQPFGQTATEDVPAMSFPESQATDTDKPESRVRTLPSVQSRMPQQHHEVASESPTEPQFSESMSDQPATVRDPAADARIPSVSVRWMKYGEVNVGQECELGLIVKNSGESAANNIAIDAFFPGSVRLIKAEPQPTESTDHLSWAISTLTPGEEQTIRIRLIPGARGELATSANVRFTGSAAGVFQVEEPILHVEIQGPQEVMAGDLASQTVVLSNPGSGIATNVTVEARIPEGLEHPRGQRLMMEIGSLAPGESRLVRLPLAAVAGGTQTVTVEAKGDANLSQSLSRDIAVIAPSIKIAVEGPSMRYIGRNADYLLTVTNDGTGASNNVRIVHQLPDGFKFVRADKGGKYDPAHKSIGWFVGRLESGQSAAVHVELAAGEPGRFIQKVAAISEHGARAEAEFPTQVDGTASLVLEIVDLNDPIEVGSETAYEVRVRNEGTAAAKNVGVSCELPSAIELLDANGPAEHLVESGLVVFKSLGQLEAGKTAIYRIHVKGRMAGNLRFRARLVSDSNEEPLIFEELTKFYGDQQQ
ncbi:MAG: hypothetical protein WD648_02985 [Planctomycetaceae bacterium]